jgi:4-amino-4-deoxy-L-arabinose transferase-like glycosyltransferase
MSQVLSRLRARWGSFNGAAGLVLSVLLIGFGLRLCCLGSQSLWYDEAVSIHLATSDLRALTLHTAADIHPPLYYYLLHFWILAAGDSEFSAAFPSLIFGMLLVVGCYRLGYDLLDRRVGLVAAILVAISPFNVWYSQEVRMYTMGAFLGLVSLYCLARLAGLGEAGALSGALGGSTVSEGRTWPLLWIGYVLSAVAGLYTLYYFAFLLLFENLFVVGWWLAQRLKGRAGPLSLGWWLLAQLLVVVLYAPWMPIAVRQALYPPVPPWRGFAGLSTMLLDSWSALSMGQSVDPESLLAWPLLSFLFAIFLLGILRRAGGAKRWSLPALLCGYTFAPLLFIYLLSLRTPLFHVRYVFTYSPPFYLLLAVGLLGLGRRARGAFPVSLAIICLASGYSIYRFHFVPQYASDDHRGAVSYIENRVAPGDAVLINAGYAYPAFLYYYQGDLSWRGRLVDYQPNADSDTGVVLLETGSIGGDQGLGWGDPGADFYATTREETARALERVFDHHDRVWVYRIYDTVTDPEGFIRGWLEEHGRNIGDEAFAGESYMRVQCYVTELEPPYDATLVSRQLDLELLPGLRLLESDIPAMARSGEQARISLRWQDDRQAGRAEELEVGLRSMEGTDAVEWLASKSLVSSGAGRASLEMDVEIPAGTPPLEYDVILSPAPSWGGEGASAGERTVIGKLRVLRPLVPEAPPRMPNEPWANFGDALQLVGYELRPEQVEPGGQLCAEILWRAWDVPLPLVEESLELRHEGAALSRSSDLLLGAYPSTLWGPQEVVRDVVCLGIPEDTSPGRCELFLALKAWHEDGTEETMPSLSPAGEWEEWFTLAGVEVGAP